MWKSNLILKIAFEQELHLVTKLISIIVRLIMFHGPRFWLYYADNFQTARKINEIIISIRSISRIIGQYQSY